MELFDGSGFGALLVHLDPLLNQPRLLVPVNHNNPHQLLNHYWSLVPVNVAHRGPLYSVNGLIRSMNLVDQRTLRFQSMKPPKSA